MSKFKPTSLSRESVEAPMQPHWRVMGEDEEKRLHARSLEQHRRWATFGPSFRRRLLRYTVATAFGVAIGGWLFVRGSLGASLGFAGVGVVLGALVAWLRPTDFVAATLYAAAAFVGGFLVHAHLLFVFLGALWFGIVGVIAGRGEEFKRLDSED